MGVLGASRGGQRGSQKRLKWSLGARIAPGGFGDLILEDFGSLWDRPGTLFGRIIMRFPLIFQLFFDAFPRLTLHPCLKRVHVHPRVRDTHYISALPVHMSRKVPSHSFFRVFFAFGGVWRRSRHIEKASYVSI